MAIAKATTTMARSSADGQQQAGGAGAGGASSSSRAADGGLIVCGAGALSLAAAMIHLWVVPEHLGHWCARGVFSTHDCEIRMSRVPHCSDGGGVRPGAGERRSAGGVHIADNKFAEGWVNFDAMGMMQQLGVIPEQG